jgi:hypothetical protein
MVGRLQGACVLAGPGSSSPGRLAIRRIVQVFVFVPLSFVCGVAVAAVDVVDMEAVGDGLTG